MTARAERADGAQNPTGQFWRRRPIAVLNWPGPPTCIGDRVASDPHHCSMSGAQTENIGAARSQIEFEVSWGQDP
jgi:hypothetical protein